MIKLSPPMPGARLDHGRKMVPFMAPHRTDHREVVDDTADIRKPVGNWNARFAVPRERAQAGNDRASHGGEIVPESNSIDELARVFVPLGIEGIDVADAAAHEQENNRLRTRLEMRAENRLLELARLRPETAHGNAQKAAARLEQKVPARDAAARE